MPASAKSIEEYTLKDYELYFSACDRQKELEDLEDKILEPHTHKGLLPNLRSHIFSSFNLEETMSDPTDLNLSCSLLSTSTDGGEKNTAQLLKEQKEKYKDRTTSGFTGRFVCVLRSDNFFVKLISWVVRFFFPCFEHEFKKQNNLQNGIQRLEAQKAALDEDSTQNKTRALAEKIATIKNDPEVRHLNQRIRLFKEQYKDYLNLDFDCSAFASRLWELFIQHAQTSWENLPSLNDLSASTTLKSTFIYCFNYNDSTSITERVESADFPIAKGVDDKGKRFITLRLCDTSNGKPFIEIFYEENPEQGQWIRPQQYSQPGRLPLKHNLISKGKMRSHDFHFLKNLFSHTPNEGWPEVSSIQLRKAGTVPKKIT